jgi:hypothetical protein
MFCSSCGAAITPDLNYCKRCGVELSGAGRADESESMSPVWSIIAVPVLSIAWIIGLVALMKNVFGFEFNLIGVITVMNFFLLLIADTAIILSLLRRDRRANKKPVGKPQLKENAAHALYESPRRELPEQMQFESVTEHTTRSLEPVLRETKKQ